MAIPLYLNIKESTSAAAQPGEEKLHPSPCFSITQPDSISFSDVTYEFAKIYSGKEQSYLDLVNNSTSSCVVLVGPTGSGKTTTLRSLVRLQLQQSSNQGTTPYLTSFEISNNKYAVDLLDTSSSAPPKISMATDFESKLLRKKASAALVKEVLKKRLTQATEFNQHSSRSCLVLTLFWGNCRTTFVDMMGSERNSASSSNVFANTNISSITQLMINNKHSKFRSHNSIANYIFKNKHLKVVLNLDPFGDEALVKSSLSNVAEVVKNYSLQLEEAASNNSSSNSSSHPGSSSAIASDSPRKPQKRVPSYSLPTVSSSCHVPKKRKLNNPGQTPISSLADKPHYVIPKLTTSVFATEMRIKARATLSASDLKVRKTRGRLPVKPLGKAILSHANDSKTVLQLKQEQAEIKDKYRDSISNIKADIGIFKQETMDLVEAFAALRKQLQHLESKQTLNVQQLEIAAQEKTQLQGEASQLCSQIDQLKAAKQTQEELIAQLEAEQKYTNAELIKSNESYAELSGLKDSLEQDLAQALVENEKQSAQIKSTREQLASEQLQSQDEARKHHDRLALLNQDLTVSEMLIESLQKEKKEQDEKFTRLEMDLKDATDKLHLSVEKSTTADKELHNLNLLLSAKDEEIRNLQAQWEQGQQQLQRDQSSTRLLSDELAKAQHLLEEKEASLWTSLQIENELRDKLAHAEQANQDWALKYGEVIAVEKSLNEKLNSAMARKLELEAAALKNGNSSREREELLMKSNQTVTELQAEVGGLKSREANLQRLYNELKSAKSQQESESYQKLTSLKETLENRDHELSRAKDECSRLHQNIREQSKTVAALEAQAHAGEAEHKQQLEQMALAHELALKEKVEAARVREAEYESRIEQIDMAHEQQLREKDAKIAKLHAQAQILEHDLSSSNPLFSIKSNSPPLSGFNPHDIYEDQVVERRNTTESSDASGSSGASREITPFSPIKMKPHHDYKSQIKAQVKKNTPNRILQPSSSNRVSSSEKKSKKKHGKSHSNKLSSPFNEDKRSSKSSPLKSILV
ncbi:uncharacterized protein LODBEIA_P17510 [Lodderomyces beijingensis]|uniref:Kinesin motor domain-containing protein n=1 Tax=Lodderomyces beijingensis TaxID=1775926 RepID=A0ABP0ZH79_9ASCO